MLCTAHVVCLAMSWSRGYNSDPEKDLMTAVELILVPSGLRNFLDYGGEKEFVVKGYVDANLALIRMTLSSKPDSYSRAII